ncbi:transposase [Turicibacter sanguinis]|uniref:IS66 family transposase n=1 Tax=Turicibacter sanguinis TaxID=154288 RepID=UPI001899AEF8|nr:transposase [Turicibacter sanguinis]MDB8555550.1 transposase [Turicibacter sanguinis]
MSEIKIQAFEKRYDALTQDGYPANPLKPHAKNTYVVSLLNRLLKHQEEVLEFLFEIKTPFDNNLTERNVRMTKTN